MIRCRDCNSVLARDETACSECGAVIPVRKFRPSQALARIVNLLFYASLGLLLLSIFLPTGPGITKSLLLTLALLLLKRSAKDSTEKLS